MITADAKCQQLLFHDHVKVHEREEALLLRGGAVYKSAIFGGKRWLVGKWTFTNNELFYK